MKIKVNLKAEANTKDMVQVDVDISKDVAPKKADVVAYLQQNAKKAFRWKISRPHPSLPTSVLVVFYNKADAEAFMRKYDPSMTKSDIAEYIQPVDPVLLG